MPEHWVKVATTDEIAEGEMIGVLIEGEDVAVYHVDGVYYATDNICTHEMARLSDGFLEGTAIECPLHAGQFDIRNGCVLAPPPSMPLRVFPIRVEGRDILVDLGEDE